MSRKQTVLATAFFDGRGSRTPSQSFAASGNLNTEEDDRGNFLHNLHEARKQREVDRKRTAASIRIQKIYRGYICRKKLKAVRRQEFDADRQIDFTPSIAKNQIKRLHNFFDFRLDGERLIWLCQNIIKMQNRSEHLPNVLSSKLLLTCLQYLRFAAPQNQAVSITMPFRCLEVFLATEMDTQIDSADVERKLGLMNSLLGNGFYEVLRALFDHRTPAADLTSEQVKAPTFQAESYMDALLWPFLILKHAASNGVCTKQTSLLLNLAYRGLILNFFAKSPMTAIIRYYILPSLANSDKLFTLRELTLHIRQFPTLPKEYRTPEFAYTVSYFISRLPLEQMDCALLKIYAAVSESMLDLAPYHKSGFDDDDEGNANREKHEPMEVDGQTTMSREWIVPEWLDLNHRQNMQTFLLKTVNSEFEEEKETILTAVIDLCRVHLHLENVDRRQCAILQILSYQPKLIRRLWLSILACTTPSLMGPPRILIEQLQKGYHMSADDRRRLIPRLSAFCSLFTTNLLTTDDMEFIENYQLRSQDSVLPFSPPELAALAFLLRDVALGLIELALPDSRPTVSADYHSALKGMGVDFSPQDTSEWNQLFEVVVRLLQILHDRDERLQFCPLGHWSARNRMTLKQVGRFRSGANYGRRNRRLFHANRYLNRQQLEEEKSFVHSAAELRNMTILRKIPFVVPFEERAELLYQFISNDQREHGRQGFWQQGFSVNARRNFIYEDAFDQLSKENAPDLTQTVRVTLKNWADVVEAGVDGGGLFREFLNELLKSGFDPHRGFFVATSHDSTLYPNPLAPLLFPDRDYRRHYFFLGRMVAKLIYENQLAELRFARFFLANILCPSDEVDVHHMSYYDPVLYKNLLRLKMEQDVAKLELDFSVVCEDFGELRKFDLKPNGRDIRVTNDNKLEYIQLAANFYLRQRINDQCEYFRAGLSDLIDLDWLQMFDYRELQILISGADRNIDVGDLRRHTVYTGDVKQEGAEDLYIESFWRVVNGFTEDQRKKLLKFVTSCSRPPLLGFKDMHPQFCIQVCPLGPNEQDRLPTASTCMNLLKLPRFQDEKTLRAKLLYAVESGAGFELS